ncbi:MAG: hypothetical protein KAS15_01080 [Nanoarchaeota archaeon]|nr:hypothetical protein [Nanoarchaeota archaeon]
MQLSKTEIRVLAEVAKGNNIIKTIAEALKKSNKQIYVTAKSLTEKGFIKLIKGTLKPKEALHITLFLQLLADIPNLAPVLSDSGIPIFIAFLKPMTIEEVSAETGFKKTMIYIKLQKAKKRSMIRKTGSTFKINAKMWLKLIDFLEELKKYEETIDARIPASSIIYYKNNKEIVFSSKEETNAVKTAFSAYQKYGIEILTITDYYYLPKKSLTKENVFFHSLYVTEKTQEIRHIIFVALFYLKFKKEFSRIRHPIIEKIGRVLVGEKIAMFPSLAEIKDRAEVYGINV